VGDDLGRFWQEFLRTFPDLTVSIDLSLTDHDRVMAFLTWRGHEAGSGRELELHTSELFEMDGGKVAAHGAVVDYCELGEFGFSPQRAEFPSDPRLFGSHTTAERANAGVVLSAYHEVMTEHRLDRAHVHYERDYLHHNAQMPAVPNGVEAFKEYFAGNFARYPDLGVSRTKSWRGTTW